MATGTRAIRTTLLGAVAVLALACGDDGPSGTPDAAVADAAAPDAAVDDEPVPVPRVELSTEAIAVTPGATIELSWTITDGEAGVGLELRAVAPGAPAATTGARWWNPGLPPATGEVRWLAGDGSWQAEPTLHAAAATSGARAVALPTLAEGAWQLQAVLRAADDTAVDAAAVDVVASSRPALHLRVDRLAAGPDDEVRAELVVAPGASPGPARVVAYLVEPDGSERVLPDALAPVRVPLLARTFGANGTYRLSARLADATTGALLALAEASFTVCATPAAVSGIARHADGSPLAAGDDVSVARVVALELEGGAWITAPLAADGTFALELRPGTYVVQAELADATGRYDAVSPAITIGGGCEPVPDVELGPPALARSLAAAPRPRAPPPPAAGARPAMASDGLPTPSVRIILDGDPDFADSELLSGYFAGRLAGRVGLDLALITMDDTRRLLAFSSQQQAAGLPGAGSNLDHYFSDDFLLFVRRVGAGPARSISVKLVEIRTNRVVAATMSRAHPEPETLTVLDELVTKTATDLASDGRSLFRVIRDAQPCPIQPRLDLAQLPDLPAGGARSVTVSATLRDVNGRTCAGQEVTLLHRTAAMAAPQPQVVTTDADGVASATFVSPGTPGVETYQAEYQGSSISVPSALRSYRVLEPDGAVGVVPDRVVVRRGETVGVEVRVRDGELSPQPTDPLTYEATIGQLAATTGTTDATGVAAVSLVVDPAATVGIGEVSARRDAAPGVRGRADYVVTDVATLTITPGSAQVVTGGATAVAGVVVLGDGPVAGIAVDVSVTGGGLVVPGRVVTGAAGEYRVEYQAPAAGAGTATVTAAIVVDGVRVTEAATVAYDDVPPPPMNAVIMATGTVATNPTIPDRVGTGVVLAATIVDGVVTACTFTDAGELPDDLIARGFTATLGATSLGLTHTEGDNAYDYTFAIPPAGQTTSTGTYSFDHSGPKPFSYDETYEFTEFLVQ